MRRSTIAVDAVLLVIATSVGYCEARARQLNRAFEKVVMGDAERDVVVKMGRLHQILEGCGSYYPHLRGRIVGCAREYLYFPPWTIVGEYWSISLNEDGVVTNTAHFVSP